MTIESLYGLIDKEWTTKDIILSWLQMSGIRINERDLRQFFENYNRKFEEGNQEYFIAHSNKGYLLTNDVGIIKSSLEDDQKRAMKLLRRSYRTKKALAQKNQLSLTEQDASIYELVQAQCVTSK